MAAVAIDNDFGYYDGSRKFLWLSELTGLKLDQVNFVMSQVAALISAVVLKRYLHYDNVSVTARHLFSAIVGIVLVYFCHGRHTVHIFAFPLICYIVLVMTSPLIFQRVILVIALCYLSFVHLMRQIYSYGSYVLDITGPMMLITQKVTSLAFSLHDGLAREENTLNSDQKKYAIRRFPSPLEFFSYIYNFQVLMCGPLIFYADYKDFVEGKHYLRTTNMNGLEAVYDPVGDYKVLREPSATSAVLKKVTASIIFAWLLLKVTPLFPLARVTENDFLLYTPLYKKVLYIFVSTSLVRFKYYHAWILADAVCNASGLGFNGYGSNGKPKWDMLSNVDVFKFETGISLRDTLENWNKSTMVWLRQVAYNRASFQKTTLTYCLSALWHGFYPGYYVTFLSGAFSTVASRTVRRSIRPLFQTSQFWARTYDVITFLVTRVLISYIVFPFVLLEFWPSIVVYRYMYFYGHIIILLSIFVLPLVLPPRRQSTRQDATSTSRKSDIGTAAATTEIPKPPLPQNIQLADGQLLSDSSDTIQEPHFKVQ